MSLPIPIPRATYRLQLRPEFGFAEAAKQLDYLRDLGVSHVYCSPITQAARGSTHGYDVVDPTRISEELGGEEAFVAFAKAARQRDLGLLIDIVPNHMSTADSRNVWWWDLLEDGRSSPFADFFDVDWNRPHTLLEGRVLVPILGDQIGRVLERGQLQLVRDEQAVGLRYFEQVLPLAPETVSTLLAATGTEEGNLIARLIAALPLAAAGDPLAQSRRRQARIDLGERVRDLLAGDLGTALDGYLEGLNEDPEMLDEILAGQHYRLAHWRIASEEINYRRFFDVTTLVALRMEKPAVFQATHSLAARLLREGHIDGVRVDHVDGLRRPTAYLQQLRELLGADAWIVVEKILAEDEELRADWLVAGTTGYEFGAQVAALLTSDRGVVPLAELYRSITGEDLDAAAVIRSSRADVLSEVLAADLQRLTDICVGLCAANPVHRDHSRGAIQACLTALLACFPVYRTYVDEGPADPSDIAIVEATVAAATESGPDLDHSLLEWLGSMLLSRVAGEGAYELAMRFPQVASATAAKGVEDTAFYRYLALPWLCEVGADPRVPSITPAQFHAFNRRQSRWATGLLATSTHDTKRSEDVRARLAALSEMPEQWATAVRRWRELFSGRRPELVDARTEYLLFCTLVGAYPLEAERALSYMQKATHEAKLYTSWLHPSADYDAAVADYVRKVVEDEAFGSDLAEFMPDVVRRGRLLSLSQTALKLTAPGIPDIYQGCELWDLSLVDPDNRRAVDFGGRADLLRKVGDLEGPSGSDDDGLSKLVLIQSLLLLRRDHPDIFAGSYEALAVDGEYANSVVAFMRSAEDGSAQIAVVAAIRSTPVMDQWADTSVLLESEGWTSVLKPTDRRTWGGGVALGELLRESPVTVLFRRGS